MLTMDLRSEITVQLYLPRRWFTRGAIRCFRIPVQSGTCDPVSSSLSTQLSRNTLSHPRARCECARLSNTSNARRMTLRLLMCPFTHVILKFLILEFQHREGLAVTEELEETRFGARPGAARMLIQLSRYKLKLSEIEIRNGYFPHTLIFVDGSPSRHWHVTGIPARRALPASLIVEISPYAIATRAFRGTCRSDKRHGVFTAIKYWRCGIIASDTVKTRAPPRQ